MTPRPGDISNEVLRRKLQEGIDALERGDYVAIRTDAEMEKFFQEIRHRGMEQMKLNPPCDDGLSRN